MGHQCFNTFHLQKDVYFLCFVIHKLEKEKYQNEMSLVNLK